MNELIKELNPNNSSLDDVIARLNDVIKLINKNNKVDDNKPPFVEVVLCTYKSVRSNDEFMKENKLYIVNGNKIISIKHTDDIDDCAFNEMSEFTEEVEPLSKTVHNLNELEEMTACDFSIVNELFVSDKWTLVPFKETPFKETNGIQGDLLCTRNIPYNCTHNNYEYKKGIIYNIYNGYIINNLGDIIKVKSITDFLERNDYDFIEVDGGLGVIMETFNFFNKIKGYEL